ncbi:MAG: hypothetical protein ACE5GT_01010 [Rhodospirillales bacterium]
MPDPGKVSLNVQLTAFQSALLASQRVTASYLRLLDKQQKTLSAESGRRRADDGGDKACQGPCGADLQDHYGRRSHDVNVERL